MLKPVVLKNGLTVLRFPKTSSNVFLCGFVVKTGSAVEPDNFPRGISHLVEKMFWSGTDKYPSKRALNTLVEGMGAQFESFTELHLSHYYLLSPYYHQKQAVSVLAEVMQHSYFDAKDLEVQKGLNIEKIKEMEESFATESAQLALNNLYGETGLGLPVQGSIESIIPITQRDVREYLARQYNPSRSYLILAGNFDSKTILQTVEQHWSLWQPKSQTAAEVSEPTVEDLGTFPRVLYKQRGIPTTHLVVSFLLDSGIRPTELLMTNALEDKTETDIQKIMDRHLQQTAILLLLNTVLGQGFSSRLWTKGVEEEMFFEKIQSNVIRFNQTGFLKIWGEAENSQFTFALESVLSVLEALKKTTISINELNKAKEQLKGSLLMDQESLMSSVVWQVKNLIGTSLTFELEDLLYKIDEVDTIQLRDLASELFSLDRLFITTLGTAKQTKLVEKLINKFLS
jgi:predicted Zn-dependent peptidase